jgi:hypothetical protein
MTPVDDSNDTNDRNDVGRISREVYRGLPDTLGDIAQHLDPGHERDSFLTGALPVVAGAMPNARFKYGGHWVSLNLYMAVIAPAGSGKGQMRYARKIGTKLNQGLHDRYEDEMEEWMEKKKSDDNEAPPEPPPVLRLFLPADSSAAALKEALEDSPHGVIFETEFKTLSIVLGQDWGKFRDLVLKGFQNEPIGSDRKTEDPTLIGHPAPSMAVSGTPDTFSEVISDTEDGLFSRFAYYSFESTVNWKDQFGELGETDLDRAVDRGASRISQIYHDLQFRENPLYITFNEEAEQVVNEACNFVMEHWKREGVRTDLYASLKRAALRAARIASITRLLHHYDQGKSLRSVESVVVGLKDVEIGLRLAFTYLVHALQIAERFGTQLERQQLRRDKRQFLEALPDTHFETNEAKEIVKEEGVNAHPRTAERWLKEWEDNTGLIDKIEWGVWTKLRPDRSIEKVPGVMSVITVINAIFGDGEPKVEEVSDHRSNGTSPR